MDREIVVNALKLLVPNLVELDISDDSNLLEQRIVDSGQLIELIVRLEDFSGKEIDFVDSNPETFTSISGLTKTFNDL